MFTIIRETLFSLIALTLFLLRLSWILAGPLLPRDLRKPPARRKPQN